MNSEKNIWKERYLLENKARREAEAMLKRKDLDLKQREIRLIELEEGQQVTGNGHFTGNDHFKMLYENNPLSLLIYDPSNYKILDVNKTAILKYGYSREEFVTYTIFDLHTEDQWKGLKNDVKNIEDDVEFEEITEWTHVTKDGHVFTVDIQACTIPYNDLTARLVQITDVTETKNLKNYIQRNDEKYQKIIENMELGLLEVDLDDQIIKAYPKFCELTGYQEHELVGLKALDIFIPDHTDSQQNYQLSKKPEGKSKVYEVKLKKKNGDYAWVLISSAPLFNVNNDIIGSLGIHVDISERKEIETALVEAKKVAEHNANVKDQFLARMSHEMRTPLNGIVGLNHVLSDTDLNETQHSYCKSINSSSEHLLNIINDILDFSKLEADRIEIENIPFSLRSIMDQLDSALRYEAINKGVGLEVQISEDLSNSFLGDPHRTYQVLLNLASNAVKFTEEGHINVAVNVDHEDENIQKLSIEIQDTGIGIKSKNIDRLFESFSQSDADTARKYGGTGLGLSIAQKLANALGGSIDVKSKLGKGSTFTFSLKLDKLEEEISDEKPLPREFKFESGVKVLLVDDNEMNRMMARIILERKEIKVVEAVDGIDAISKVKAHSFDLVLMDIMMPNMDGFEATKKIRLELNSDVPIIALTANAIIGDDEKCLDSGMQDYLSKPFAPDDLYEAIFNNLAN